MFAEAVNQTVGIALGTFLGAMLGLSIRARSGKPLGLFRGSVLATSIVAAMLAWTVAAVLQIVMG
ncbi:hypothetical protein [Cognatishimia sp. F0-27]|uniref:hypothetical protein n=1 Tax=Cognatishimia sp. F0-27 TaxID=2816855 RepID=UPI001D0CBDD3|nr:hypothetical protein [Cognatishimia sp. F0-27]MCC1491645.1 hypothetical protein [Cognatishimia sp. F0-27]